MFLVPKVSPFLIATLLLVPVAGHAATVTVGPEAACDFDSLEAALAGVATDPSPSPTVRLVAGIHPLVHATINRSLSVEGGYASCTASSPSTGLRSILDGEDSGRPITIVGRSSGAPIEVRLTGLALENGFADHGGGLRITLGAAVVLDNILVLGNRAEQSGGGIDFDGTSSASLTLLGSGVNANDAVTGGGIHCRGGHLTATATSGIGGNRATTLGGGIRASLGCVLELDGPVSVSFNNGSHGGGIYVDSGARALLRGHPGATTSVRNNVATAGGTFGGTGGGIGVSGLGSRLEAIDVHIERNRALHTGGGGGRGGGVEIGSQARAVIGQSDGVSCDGMSCSILERNEARHGAAVSVGFRGTGKIFNSELVDNQGEVSIVDVGSLTPNALLVVEGVYLHRNSSLSLFHAEGASTLELTHVTAANNFGLSQVTQTSRLNDRSPELRLHNSVFGDPFPMFDNAPQTLVSAECLFVANTSELGDFPLIFADDPRLVDPLTGNLRLASSSPAIDRCFERVTEALLDTDGDTRGFVVTGAGAGFDAGADELGTREIFSDGFESGTLSAWDSGP